MSPDLAQRLREVRERAGISQRELGRRLTVDGSFISHIEAGRRPHASVDLIERWISECGAALLVVAAPTELQSALDRMRPGDAARVVQYADALRRLPELPPGPMHPGDIALAVVEHAAAVGPKP